MVPDDVVRLRDQLDDVVLGYDQGTLAARPAAGVEGRFYYATDGLVLYYDFGGGWVPASFQPGDVRWSAALNGTPPLGWFACDGGIRGLPDRTTYRALFDAIGTTFGAGNGSTTFGLPDLRGRAPVGVGQGFVTPGLPQFGSLTHRAIGAAVGAETHSLTAAQNGVHAHDVYDPGHNHGGGTHNGAADRPAPGWGSYRANASFSLYGIGGYGAIDNMGGSDNGLHAHGIPSGRAGVSIYNNGSGAAHNNMQPSLALHAWIKY
ncbi:phage tail protein [Conexibacter woesei]|uniref:Tail Collar domain protein n=1 Tax=Conexibacter woesei (strain DSM 14684 / CCUG 47730 / CIP 108061 / JCM 11494 / NBRC 100937 / ID131577) TaxID=469383 RepID=D3F201_CONWI|nr:tail fiber protein [Conexibacter woesei]ADB50176.1 Tail Collar domain protein [Conexibacter woesei DSM 14684]